MARFPALLAIVLAWPALSAAADVRYACGGIGADERRSLEQRRGDASLEVLFVTAKRGAYLSDARLTVQQGGATVLDTVANGPICLIDVPPGGYRIEARIGDVVRTQQVKVSGGRSPARVVMAFPDEPWDGIRASEEEKRQAREP